MNKTEWHDCLLGDLIELKRGYDLPTSQRKPGPFPIISSSGVTGTHEEAKVNGPGVVTGRYGTLGEVFYVSKDFWPLNTSLYVRDFKGNDPRFIAFFLKSLEFRNRNAAGAVPGVNRNHLHQLRVSAPIISVQRRIASILSAYDDLIENNTRRIAILEEMARRLYEEWFVYFRFPGHEETDFVDDSDVGVRPEDWERKTLGDYVTLLYGKALKLGDRVEGPYPVFGSGGIVGCHQDYLVEGPGIIVGRKGNVGSVYWTDQSFYPIDTVFYVRTNLPLGYVYLNLQRQNFLNNDAAVPGLNRNQAYGLPFLCPPDHILESFQSQCGAMYKMVRLLERKNTNLRAQRDLLLPKLVSGEIDVSDIPLPDEEDAAA